MRLIFLSYIFPYERHSHVSLLINMGFTALAIGNRVGHESEKITYRYAHLFPSVQDDMAQALDEEWKDLMLQKTRKSNLSKRINLDLSHRSWNISLHEIRRKK